MALASPATSSDPLVTLSYLTGPFMRNFVNPHVSAQVTVLTNTFNNRARDVELNITNSMASNQAQVFVFRTLPGGERFDIPSGAEIMLRSGSVSITSGRFINTTAGTAEQTSGQLISNNMFLAAEAGSITAGAGSATFLVRGANIAAAAASSFDIDGYDFGDTEENAENAADTNTLD